MVASDTVRPPHVRGAGLDHEPREMSTATDHAAAAGGWAARRVHRLSHYVELHQAALLLLLQIGPALLHVDVVPRQHLVIGRCRCA